jgi:hypothetical protein
MNDFKSGKNIPSISGKGSTYFCPPEVGGQSEASCACRYRCSTDRYQIVKIRVREGSFEQRPLDNFVGRHSLDSTFGQVVFEPDI